MPAPPSVSTELRESLGSPEARVQKAAADTYARVARNNAAVVSELISLLKVDSPQLRWGATYALSLLGSFRVEAAGVLIENLASADSDRRWAAAAILTSIGADQPVVRRDLLDLVTTGTAVQRRMALYCIRNLCSDSDEFDAVVGGALMDPDSKVRLAAMSCSVPIADRRPEAVHWLAERLHDEDVALRRAAVAHLGKLRSVPSAVVVELEALEVEADAMLRRGVERTLARLRGKHPRSV